MHSLHPTVVKHPDFYCHLTAIDGIDLPHFAVFCCFRDLSHRLFTTFSARQIAVKRGRNRLFRRLIAFDKDPVCLPREGTNQPRFATSHHEKPRYSLIFTTDLLPNIEPQYDKDTPARGTHTGMFLSPVFWFQIFSVCSVIRFIPPSRTWPGFSACRCRSPFLSRHNRPAAAAVPRPAPRRTPSRSGE